MGRLGRLVLARAAEMALALDANYGEKPAWAALQQELRPPPAPGRPAAAPPGTIRTGVKHDRGTYLVSWDPALDFDGDPLTYRLEHRDADDATWSPVATGIRRLDYRFSADGYIEQQGTWRYRVRAADPTGASDLHGRQRRRGRRPRQPDRADPDSPTARPPGTTGTATASRSASPTAATRRSRTAAPGRAEPGRRCPLPQLIAEPGPRRSAGRARTARATRRRLSRAASGSTRTRRAGRRHGRV